MEVQIRSPVKNQKNQQLGDDEEYSSPEKLWRDNKLKLTPLQDRVIQAIENSDAFMFEKMGGTMEIDLNFSITKEGIFPLLVASAKGDKEMVKLILKNPKLDINKTDSFGVNAFWISAFYSHIDIMKLLISKGIDLMCKNQNGSNALHIAVKRNNLQVTQALLDIHYPLDYTKNNGVTAVGIAAHKGNIKILDMLYRAGADINFKSKIGVNPLYLAIKNKQIETVKYLVERKAQVHIHEPLLSEFSPLFFCIKLGHQGILEILCDSGINLDNCFSSVGYGPLALAFTLNFDNIVNYLSLRVKNLNQEDTHGYTAFSKSVCLNKIDMANKLLARGGEDTLNYCNKDGRTPLSLAILEGNIQAVSYLLTKGAYPHIEDLQGKDSCDHAKESQLFLDQPVFNNCLEHMRRGPNRKLIDVKKESPKKEIVMKQQKQYSTKVDNPIKEYVQILPIKNISLPQIDSILAHQQSQNRISRKSVKEILGVDRNPYSQRIAEQFKQYNQIAKKTELDLMAEKIKSGKEEKEIQKIYQPRYEVVDQLQRYSFERDKRNSQLKLKRTQERDQISKNILKNKDHLLRSISNPSALHGNMDKSVDQSQTIRQSFWEKESKILDLNFNQKLKDSELKLQQIKDTAAQLSNVQINVYNNYDSTTSLQNPLVSKAMLSRNHNNHSYLSDNSENSRSHSVIKQSQYKHPKVLQVKNKTIQQPYLDLSQQNIQQQDSEYGQSRLSKSSYRRKKHRDELQNNKREQEVNIVTEIGTLITSNISKLRQQIQDELQKTIKQDHKRNSFLTNKLQSFSNNPQPDQSISHHPQKLSKTLDIQDKKQDLFLQQEHTKNDNYVYALQSKEGLADYKSIVGYQNPVLTSIAQKIFDKTDQQKSLPEIKSFVDRSITPDVKGTFKYEFQFASQKQIKDVSINNKYATDHLSYYGIVRDPPTLQNKSLFKHDQMKYSPEHHPEQYILPPTLKGKDTVSDYT